MDLKNREGEGWKSKMGEKAYDKYGRSHKSQQGKLREYFCHFHSYQKHECCNLFLEKIYLCTCVSRRGFQTRTILMSRNDQVFRNIWLMQSKSQCKRCMQQLQCSKPYKSALKAAYISNQCSHQKIFIRHIEEERYALVVKWERRNGMLPSSLIWIEKTVARRCCSII